MHSRLLNRLLLCAGIAGPVLFFSTVLIVASLRPGYSHVNQFMSELGETGGQFAWAMNYLGFMLSATLILIFVLAFRTRLPRTALKFSWNGSPGRIRGEHAVGRRFFLRRGVPADRSISESAASRSVFHPRFSLFYGRGIYLGAVIISQRQLARVRDLFIAYRHFVSCAIDSDGAIGGLARRYRNVSKTLSGYSFSVAGRHVG